MQSSQLKESSEPVRTYKVSRRFSDFEAFHNSLQHGAFVEYLLPPLPEKQIFLRNYVEKDESEFVAKRMADLEYYLVRLNAHHRIRFSKELREFLSGEKLDSATIDHLAGYTKSLKGQFERLKTNKIYTNIMALASTKGEETLGPVPLQLEAEYHSELAEAINPLIG